jgi:hypothetical protein
LLDPLDPPRAVVVPALPPEFGDPPEPIGAPPALGLAALPWVSLPHAPQSATHALAIASGCALLRRETAPRRRPCPKRLDKTSDSIRITSQGHSSRRFSHREDEIETAGFSTPRAGLAHPRGLFGVKNPPMTSNGDIATARHTAIVDNAGAIEWWRVGLVSSQWSHAYTPDSVTTE